jgi:hypothetical protein
MRAASPQSTKLKVPSQRDQLFPICVFANPWSRLVRGVRCSIGSGMQRPHLSDSQLPKLSFLAHSEKAAELACLTPSADWDLSLFFDCVQTRRRFS